VKRLRARCNIVSLVTTSDNMRCMDKETTAGKFYNVVDTSIPSLDGNTYIALVGNSGEEIQRRKELFTLVED